MQWASTVVKLPLVGSSSWLSEEMKNFPEEFLLFSDRIGTLEFEDRLQDVAVSWSATRNANRVTLSNGTAGANG